MLRGIEPLLGPEFLFVLASMGHGDDIVVCDENFPAVSTARMTTHGSPVRLHGVGLVEAARALLSVMPLDLVEPAVGRMEVAGEQRMVPDVQRETLAEVDRWYERGSVEVVSLDRFAFYERARQAHAVVWTGERRLYGCFVFKKGVIGP
jgi:L-fucose mutarotase